MINLKLTKLEWAILYTHFADDISYGGEGTFCLAGSTENELDKKAYRVGERILKKLAKAGEQIK